MAIFIIILILAVLLLKCFQLKLVVDWKSLFRRRLPEDGQRLSVLFAILENKGIGKTYSAVKYLIESKLDKDYIIVTNMKSFKPFADTVYIENLYDLIDFCKDITDNDKSDKPIIILFDEIFSLINKNYMVDEEIMTFISQLRKRHIILVTTAQEWSEINISFRKYVRFQVSCRMFSIPFFRTAFCINNVNDGESLKLNPQTMEYEAPVIRTKLFKGNKMIVDSYDTFETIKVFKKQSRKNSFVNYVGDVKK